MMIHSSYSINGPIIRMFQIFLAWVNVNITVMSGEHVPEVELQRHLIKERTRVVHSTLPFKKIPGRMIIELVNYVVLCLNAFLPSSRVSDTYSPRTIGMGTALDYVNHCKLPCGAYSEAHEAQLRMNTTDECNHGTI
jgi:hypothetical protein